MEFGITETKTNLSIIWNGPLEELCRKMIISSISKIHHMRIYLFYPKMPANHVACLIDRLRKNWFDVVGRSTDGASKAKNTLNKLQLDQPLITDDSKLLTILEDLGLDDVASDLDLIAVKCWESNSRTNSIWAFGFSPDDVDHFLKNVKITTDQMCYGRNGDTSLI